MGPRHHARGCERSLCRQHATIESPLAILAAIGLAAPKSGSPWNGHPMMRCALTSKDAFLSHPGSYHHTANGLCSLDRWPSPRQIANVSPRRSSATPTAGPPPRVRYRLVRDDPLSVRHPKVRDSAAPGPAWARLNELASSPYRGRIRPLAPQCVGWAAVEWAISSVG